MNQETTESNFSIQILVWLDQNKKPLIVGAAVVAALYTFVYTKNHLSEMKHAEAEAALFGLHASMTAEEGDGPAPGEFVEIAESHPGTTAGTRARILAAGAFFKNGQYAEAKAEFEKVLSGDPNGMFAASAQFGVAACIEAQGQTAEALKAYETFIASNPEAAEVSQARLAVGRLQEANGDFKAAHASYKAITTATDFSAWTALAQEGIARLEKAHPELQESIETEAVPSPVDIPVQPSGGTTPPMTLESMPTETSTQTLTLPQTDVAPEPEAEAEAETTPAVETDSPVTEEKAPENPEIPQP